MKILLVGGAGYIGSHTYRLLLDRGHDVLVYDNLSSGHRCVISPPHLVVGDLADQHLLDHTVLSNRIEAVVHFAAHAQVGESVTHPSKYYRNNVVNSIQLLECLRKNGVPRLVFSSSAAVYGNPQQEIIDENHPKLPINPYGRTKWMIEQVMADYAEAYGLSCTALRYFNAAGAASDGTIGEDHTPETHLIPLAIQAALGVRPELAIFGEDYPTPDGTCIRDFIHVTDLALAHALALEDPTPGYRAFNLGNGHGFSVKEIVQAVERISGKTVPVRLAARRPGDPPRLVASSEQIRQHLGWQASFPTLDAIISSAWQWHSSHPQGYGG
ncbi:MAG: UDP-glucose 4-epimerase GalE [Zavarzinella sp.]